ncbi:MAG TPA: ABC transporter ATP-binding protein/permease [Beijerinckiaceae bacterium]|jgi:putative ATP-binding cassette transporter
MAVIVTPDDPRDLTYDRQVARQFGRFVAGWWRGPTARRAWFLTVALATLVIANIGLNLAVNQWNRVFFDALERRDAATLAWAVLVFAGLVVVIAGMGVLIVITRETLQVRWREWLVHRLTGLWLTRQRYYRLALARIEPANPEYRIADESKLSTEPVVDFAIDLLNALLSFVAFIGILWTVGGSISFEVFGSWVTIPAYMTVAAVLYGLLMSALTVYVGRPLVPGVAAKNEAEARFRFELTRLRENAESIALIRGEPDERGILSRSYGRLVGRWLSVVALHGRLTWITNASGALIPVVPLLLATPKYLSGDLTLGAVTQLAAAFFQVQVAFAWLVDRYKFVAMWYASARRVMALVEAAEELDQSLDAVGGIERLERPDPRLVLQHLTVADRDGRVLIRDADAVIEAGEKVLILGESGAGKSTLMRAIAGLWPWGQGRILVPRDTAIAFVPPRPYLPLGTLREAILYPALDLEIGDDEISAILDECGLGAWSERLDAVERWDQILSSGERQRLAFARLFLQKPAVAILDEATSALDEGSQAGLMRLMRSELPTTTVISVGQRPEAEAFHDRCLRLVRTDGGARLVDPATVLPVRARA